jgi:drug/metabolite transporter (DMT)-like permease
VARRRARLLAAVAGLLIGGANVLLMVALHAGSVAVVAVLVNLYPVATVLLAWIVLRERVNALQGTGIVLAVAASVMLGLA